MPLKLDNIAPVSDEKLGLLAPFGEVTLAPAFVAGASLVRKAATVERFPRAERVAQARSMIDAGELDNTKIAATCGLTPKQVESIRAQRHRFW